MIFNSKEEINKIIKFIRDYYFVNSLKGIVIGISGGKDSAVVSALFTKALGKENVLGVTLPCHSKEEDKRDAKLISNYYGFELINIDLTNTYDSFTDNFNNYNEEELNNSNINLKPKLRMSSLYYLSALYSRLNNGIYLVAGTSNKSELYVGYFTKGGDSTYDIGVLNDYTKEEVIMLGKYLKVPDKVLYKTPNDGVSNMSDEDKLGVTYKDIDSYLNGKLNNKKTIEKIELLHNKNNHKFNIPIFRRY